jgi:hypothetical protein
MDNLGCSRTSNNNPLTVIGRVASRSGQVVDSVFEGSTELKTTDALEIQRLIQRPSDLAKDFLGSAERALALVGVGFGAAPISDFDRVLWKGEFDEAEHSRVPGGCPEGGEFCSAGEASNAEAGDQPVDGLINQNTVMKDISSKLAKRAARKILRGRLIAGLRFVAGLAADIIPYLGELFDGYEIGQTIEDGIALDRDISAAELYVRNGPQALEDLRISAEDRSFSSADAFKKDALGKFYGPAGPGYDYHHIVWQGGANADNIPAELLHSTENMVRIPRLLHEEITAAYSEDYEHTGKSLREWLDTQPYDVQRAEGIKVMRRLGIIK